jgi:peroxiredoxin
LYNVNQLDFNRLCYNSPDVKFNFEGLYNLAKENYTGKTRERILANMLLNQLLFNPSDAISSEHDYLAGNIDTSFKQIVHYKYDFQKKFGNGNNEINFTLPDTKNQLVSLDQFKGKVVLLDFWFNGCVGCASSFQAMQEVTKYFKNNDKVVFLNVSVDKNKDRWLKGIKLYHISNDINLYTEGKGDVHQTIKSYGILGYPAQFLIDQNGKYITGNPPRPDKDAGKALIALIENSLKNQRN